MPMGPDCLTDRVALPNIHIHTNRGDYGQLGTGAIADSLTPALVEAVSGRGILSLACGQYHSCVATAEAGLLTMGKNDFGQCGVQDTSPRLLPGPVATPLAGVPVVQTTAGYYHTTVLTASGSVFAFGRNDFGACVVASIGWRSLFHAHTRRPRPRPPQTPPTTGQLGLGTRENSWRPQEVKGLLSKTIVQISAGCYHTLALDDGGNCWAAGRNNHCAFWVWFVGLVIWLSGWGCVWSAHIMTCPTTTTTTTPQ